MSSELFGLLGREEYVAEFVGRRIDSAKAASASHRFRRGRINRLIRLTESPGLEVSGAILST